MSITVYEELENLIIGGEFNINPWQRNTTFVSPVSGDYTADRFQYRNSGTQVYTVTQEPSGPTFAQSGLDSTQSFRIDVTTANATIGTSEFTSIEQPMEGYIALPLYGNVFSISFWAFSVLPGVYCVAFQDDARNRSYILEYTINSASTWENFEFVIAHDASVGTWNSDSSTGLRVIFTLTAGTSFHGTADTWQAGNLIATSNQVNLAASTANDFRVDLIRIKRGIINQAFILRDRITEISLCQRYYEKSYNIGVFPTAVTDVGENACKQASDSQIRTLQNPFRNTKRVTPTIAWYSPVTGVINNIHRYNAAADHAVISTTATGQRSTGWPTIGSSVGTEWGAHWTAEAEL